MLYSHNKILKGTPSFNRQDVNMAIGFSRFISIKVVNVMNSFCISSLKKILKRSLDTLNEKSYLLILHIICNVLWVSFFKFRFTIYYKYARIHWLR